MLSFPVGLQAHCVPHTLHLLLSGLCCSDTTVKPKAIVLHYVISILLPSILPPLASFTPVKDSAPTGVNLFEISAVAVVAVAPLPVDMLRGPEQH